MHENIKMNDEQQKKLVEFALKRFKVMRDWRDEFDDDVEEGIDLYNQVTRPKAYKWMSNLFVPYIYSIIRTLLPKLTNSLLGSDKILNAESKLERFVTSENKIATYAQTKYKIMNFKKKARDICLASLKYPWAILKMRWRYEVDTFAVKEYPKIFGMPVKFLPPRDVKKTKVVYDDPDIEHIPYENFWMDPDATSLEDSRDCIHRTIKDYNYIKAMDNVYMNLDKLEKSKPPQDLRTFIKSDEEEWYEGVDKGYNEVEILEFFGTWEVDGENVEIIATIGNRETLLRVKKNDYYGSIKPFVLFTPLSEDSRSMGKTLPVILKSLQNELNDNRNARMDNLKLILRKTYKILNDSDVDLKKLFAGPDNAVFVDNMDEIEEIEFKNIINAIQNEESDIKNDMQQTSGATDYNMGTSAGRGINSTATGVSIITSEASSRIKEMVDNLAGSFLKMTDMMFMFLRQYKTEDEVLRMYQKGVPVFNTVTLEELHSDYYFEYNLQTLSANPQAEQQTYVGLLNSLGNFPWINVRALVRTVLEKFKVKNVGEIMNYEAYRKEIKEQLPQGVPGQVPGVSPPEVVPGQQTPEERITEIGKLGSPVDPTLKQPVQAIPQLAQLQELLAA